MLRTLKRTTILFLGVFALSACQNQNPVKVATNSGFGGTGKPIQKSTQPHTKTANKSGFGGTGKLAKNSGIGGTGIIGTITKFGSIWVNGIEVEYNKNVKITSNLSKQKTLQLGQQVIVETYENKKMAWTDRIRIFYPIAGQITSVKSHHIRVDNHIIFVNNQTKIAPSLKIKEGVMVAISGYPDQNNQWIATRIDPNPNGKHLFQTTPNFKFSNTVNKVLIETTKSQLADWNQAFSGLNVTLIESTNKVIHPQKYLLKANVHNGKITSYDLHEYQNNTTNKTLSNADWLNSLKENYELEASQRDLTEAKQKKDIP